MSLSAKVKARAFVYSVSAIFGGGVAIAFMPATATMGPLIGPLVGLGAGAVAAFTGERSVVKNFSEAEEPLVSSELMSDLPKELKTQFIELERIYKLYRAVESPISRELESIITNAQALFERINERIDSQSGRLAAVNYTDILQKLNHALGERYYLDILKNPNFWDKPAERLEAVESAVIATNGQLLRQIRQVNASQDMDYSISLDGLMSAVESQENSSTLLGDN